MYSFGLGAAVASRAPHGARGLKHRDHEGLNETTSRAPHGARGLKLLHWLKASRKLCVAPHTGRVD